MEQESFIFNLNSQGSSVVTNTNPGNVTYNVNWGSLPTKYSKFKVVCNFRSYPYLPGGAAVAGTVLTDVGWININFGKSFVYDGSSNIGNVAMIYPIVTNTIAYLNSSYYCCTSNDNSPFIMDYPQSGLFTITLKTFAGAFMTNPRHYNLQLCITGIINENTGNSNLLANNKPTTN